MIRVEIKGDTELRASFRGAGERMRFLLQQAVKKLVLMGQQRVVTDKLQGQVLAHRSGNLQRSVLQSGDVVSEGYTIIGSFGVGRTAPYGKVHEYGGTYSVREYIRANGSTVRAHDATYPERSFLRSTFREMEPTIRQELEKAAMEALKG